MRRVIALLTQYPWILLIGLALPALWPFYSEGLSRSFDGGLHLLRIGRLDDHIRQGVLYPRWIPELMLGHGYPVFSYYAPSTYYLVELFHLIGFEHYHAFMLALGLLLLAAGFGMYMLARDSFNVRSPWPALVSATAYLYSPYLLTNIHIRGAIAEVGALALVPWIFWSTRRLICSRHSSHYVLPVALSLGALAVTHNISLLFVPPVLLGYAALTWWRGDREPRVLGWMLAAFALAMGISAFFWLPLIAERHYLSDRAYTIAKNAWLPRSMWTWNNFLDTGLTFTHTFARPIRIGLVATLLSIAGFIFARRRDGEWIYFFVVALGAVIFGGKWALPLWQNNDILPIAQFPWRLLSVVSMPMALFTGGIVLHIRPRLLQAGGGIALILFIIFTHQPRLNWIDVFSSVGVDLAVPVSAQLELDEGIVQGGQGNSAIHEYRPRWAGETLALTPDPGLTAMDATLQIVKANAHDLQIAVDSPTGGPLRFHTFYFPGWQVQVDGQQALQTYPSTSLGLLTVDLPPGEHSVSLRWTGTVLQRWATWTSVLALTLLTLVVWRHGGRRRFIVLPLAFLVAGILGMNLAAPMVDVTIPQREVAGHGLSLRGFRGEQADSQHIYLYPYWYVTDMPPSDLVVRWQILDADGLPVSEMTGLPYYNTVDAENWPVGTLIDDAYRLPVPADLRTGTHRLAVQLEGADGVVVGPVIVGELDLVTPVGNRHEPTHLVDVQFGDSVQLGGFDLISSGKPHAADTEQPAVIAAGSPTEIRLYWHALDLIDENYHGFVHLVDALGNPVAQEDHLPGPFFRPPRIWDNYTLQPDTYRLRIPATTDSGLYWPMVGLYGFEDQHRLPVWREGDDEPGDHFRLPPVKVLGRPTSTPEHELDAHFGDFASLFGYSVQAPTEIVQPGAALTVQLFFQTDMATDRNYTRFVQIFNPTLGMAAQADSQPQGGLNPTWSWIPGEMVMDSAALRVNEDAAPGTYTIYVGFYDAEDSGARLPVRDDKGDPLPDSWLPLAEIEVAE